MPMVPDPMRAVCGEPCGNQILEEFLRSRLKVCVITTKHNPDILSKDEVKWMSSLGIEIETLQCPANWKDGFSVLLLFLLEPSVRGEARVSFALSGFFETTHTCQVFDFLEIE